MSRSIKRTMLKKQYEKFCEAWNTEKAYQRLVLAEAGDLPTDTVPLGKKPTFKMWLTALKNGQFDTQQPEQAKKAVEVTDTTWEE